MAKPTMVVKYNVDDRGNLSPVKIQGEVKQIAPMTYQVALEQVPDSLNRVIVTNEDGTPLTEVFERERITENTYMVNYNRGYVVFHSSKSGQNKIFNYYGKGIELVSCSRIYDENDLTGNLVTRTLQDIIDLGRKNMELISQLGNAVIIINKLADDIHIGGILHEQLENDITIGTPIKDVLHADILEAKKWKDVLHSDVAEGKTLSPELRKNIIDGETTNTKLVDTTNNAQDTVNKIEQVGGKSSVITQTMWGEKQLDGFYKYIYNHKLGTKVVDIDGYYLNSGMIWAKNGKTIDNNNIEIWNDTNEDLVVNVFARAYSGSITTLDAFDTDSLKESSTKKYLKPSERDKITSIDNIALTFVASGSNDTQRLKSLISEGYKNFKLSKGKYFIDLETIFIGDNISLTGEYGTIIEYIGSDKKGIKFLNSNNIKLKNITFQYALPQVNRTDNGHNIEFNNCTNIDVIGCNINYAKAMGLTFIGSTNINIEKNTINNTLSDGIHLLGCKGKILIDNNSINGTKDDGIAFNNYTNTTLENYGAVVRNNFVSNTSPGRGIMVNGCCGIIIDGNTTKDTDSCGIRIGCDKAFGVVGSRDIKIINNTIINPLKVFGSGYGGIEVGEWDSAKYYNKINENIIISDNEIINSGSYGIDIYSTKGVIVKGNIVAKSNRSNNIANTSLQIVSCEEVNCDTNTLKEDSKVINGIYLEDIIVCNVIGNILRGMTNPNVVTSNCVALCIGLNTDSERSMTKFKPLEDIDFNGKIITNLGRIEINDGGFIRLGSTVGNVRCIWFDGPTQSLKFKQDNGTIRSITFS